MLLHEPHKEMNSGKGYQKRDQAAHEECQGLHGHKHIALDKILEQTKDARPHHDGHGKIERELGGHGTCAAQDETADDRGARARGAGHHGEHLKEPDANSRLPVQLLYRLHAGIAVDEGGIGLGVVLVGGSGAPLSRASSTTGHVTGRLRGVGATGSTRRLDDARSVRGARRTGNALNHGLYQRRRRGRARRVEGRCPPLTRGLDQDEDDAIGDEGRSYHEGTAQVLLDPVVKRYAYDGGRQTGDDDLLPKRLGKTSLFL